MWDIRLRLGQVTQSWTYVKGENMEYTIFKKYPVQFSYSRVSARMYTDNGK
jgi:hypothetical protein